MNKNTSVNYKLLSKSNIAIFISILAILGFFVSRGLSSTMVTLFGLNALWNINPKKWFSQKWWWLCVLWVAFYAITYFWSIDKHSWHERIDQKLPFLLLPLSFAFLPGFTIKQLLFFTVVVSVMMLCGAGYSTWFFIKSPGYYIHEYSYAKILPTPVENDHISFSLSVTLFIVWCVYFIPFINSRVWKWFIGITVALLSIYLHLLSAKSGLLAWYVFVLFYIVYTALKKRIFLVLGMILALAIFIAFALKYIPTLNNRIGYTEYSLMKYQKGDSTGNYSDLGRIMSDDISIKLIKQHPWAGVGVGDILEGMKKEYTQWYPNVKEEQMLFPHNQFLVVGVGCGIPGLIIFLILIIYPAFNIKKDRQGFFTIITWVIMLIPLMVEPFLEIQFGVFVYLFFLLWIWKIKIIEPTNTIKGI